ncbi:hypothetical protein D9Q98_004773 [Chlorella vulgaris]|uniref:Uncharacterized protein n=1 Tax=Chlorella vulgaris TaxID=3077 RepID=A0A9D4YXC1_CHLVU|nr:hypothetical protein D9Q98_004773 [Chlorella vulgaris]
MSMLQRGAAFDATAHTGAAPRPSTAAARRSPPARAARHASTAGSSGATSATGRQPARSVATAAAAAPALTTEQRATTAVAFATALDAGSSLPVTWMSHWQQQAELQVARRVIINATRGRQQQRHREVSTLLALGSDSGTSAGTTAAAVAYQAQAVPERASPAPASADAAQVDALARLLGSSTGSLDMPPLQEMSEVDQLTWLASHPQLEEEPAVSTASLPAPNGSTPLCMQQGQPQPQQQPQPQYQQTQQQQWRRQEQPWEGALDTDASGSLETATLQGPVQLRVDGDELNVRPLWIAVFQPAAEGPAKLFESVVPLLPDLVGRLSSEITPFCSVTGLVFDGADEAGGGWHNYFVGLVGSVSAAEDEILWPNQVLHRDRVLFNVRNGWDVAKFLAQPSKQDVEEHRDNLQRLAAERGYRKGWAWHMLKLRWGAQELRRLGVEL